MLYEVITVRVPVTVGGFVREGLKAVERDFGVEVIRVVDGGHADMDVPIVCSRAGVRRVRQAERVITSYSIHYTKLYEYPSADVYQWCAA